jgi:hypothetical protein
MPFEIEIDTRLADGSHARVDVHRAEILWDGSGLPVAVLAMDGRPLLGTALLNGHNLNADFVDGGPVVITSLQGRVP